MALDDSPLTTCLPLPANLGPGNNHGIDTFTFLVPIHIVTNASQLPQDLLNPSPGRQLVVGFDCEGVNLSRHGTLCIIQISTSDAIYIVDIIKGGKELMNACKPAIESAYVTKVVHDCKRDSEALYFQYGIKLHNVVDTQIAYALIQEQQGLSQPSNDNISFISLLADHRFCGISYLEKKEIHAHLMQDPMYWTYRPFTKQMIHTAADDVRFLPYIYHRIMNLLNEQSLWKLAVRGVLHCRCFCINSNGYADWPSLPSVPVTKFRNKRYYPWLMFRLGKWDTLLGRRELQSNI